MSVDKPLVSARGFGWRHAGRKNPTLTDINLTIEAGEKILLLGPSGAGKSTLLAAIAGVLGDDSDGIATGELLIDGHPASKTRGVVGLVLQDPDSQVISARVGDDVAFGAENLGVPKDETWRRVRRGLELVGLNVPLDHPTTQLSGGQKQRLALAGVLAMGARVICLDEPTANVDRESVPKLRDAALYAAEKSGSALIVVEHRVDAWINYVDRVIVVDSHGIVADGSPEQVLKEQRTMLRNAGVWLPGATPLLAPAGKAVLPNAPSILTTENLSIGYGARGALVSKRSRWSRRHSRREFRGHIVASDISLSIPESASTCLVGPNGTGKSTLALTLGGLLTPAAGTVMAAQALRGATRESQPYFWSSKLLANRIGNVFQTPEHQFVTGTVREELELGPKLLGIDATVKVDELMERLRLNHLAMANPFSLSGGEKRRLSVATVLATAPQLLILDEPTFGQDSTTFTELLTLLRELVTEAGVSVLSVTHDPLVIRAMGDRIIDFSEFSQLGHPDRREPSQSNQVGEV